MIQTDVFSTFAIGCALATAAGDGLKASNKRTRTKYFVYLLLLLSLVFLPIKSYMLWEHTGYETLFYYDASMPGTWAAATSFGNMLSGVLGFQAGRYFIRQGKELSAYTLWTAANTLVVFICGSHYERFLYPGGMRDWHLGKTFELKDFLYTETFKMLIGTHLLIAVPLFYAQVYWPREEGYLTKERKFRIQRHCSRVLAIEGVGAGIVFSLAKLAHLVPSEWGWERLAAIMFGQFIYGMFQLIPILLMSTKYVVTTEIAVRKAKLAKTSQKKGPRRRSQMPNGVTSNGVSRPYGDHQDNYSESSADTASQSDLVQIDSNDAVTEGKDA